MGGQPVYDVAWGYTIYEKAKKMGLGKVLNLWDKPYLY
jgi:ornithine cyclodeaminase